MVHSTKAQGRTEERRGATHDRARPHRRVDAPQAEQGTRAERSHRHRRPRRSAGPDHPFAREGARRQADVGLLLRRQQGRAPRPARRRRLRGDRASRSRGRLARGDAPARGLGARSPQAASMGDRPARVTHQPRARDPAPPRHGPRLPSACRLLARADRARLRAHRQLCLRIRAPGGVAAVRGARSGEGGRRADHGADGQLGPIRRWSRWRRTTTCSPATTSATSSSSVSSSSSTGSNGAVRGTDRRTGARPATARPSPPRGGQQS